MEHFLGGRFRTASNALLALGLMAAPCLVVGGQEPPPGPPPRDGGLRGDRPRMPGGPPPWAWPGGPHDQGRPLGPGGPGFPHFEAIERLNSLTPEQRERFLGRLPEERRRVMEERMERFRNMPPEEKARLRELFEQFQQMDPEQQDRARRAFRRFNFLPEERREALQGEMDALRRMNVEERRRYMRTPQFREKFPPPDQRLMLEMMGIFEPGPRPPRPMRPPGNPDDHH